MKQEKDRRDAVRRTADRPAPAAYGERSAPKRGTSRDATATGAKARRVAADRDDAERADDDGMAGSG